MKQKVLNLCLLVTVAASIGLSSCQKEVAELPQSEAENKATLIFIRAVDKDSTFTTSEQILLR